MSNPFAPVDPDKDPNRFNPEPHWRVYDHPKDGPVAVCVQDFDYHDYDRARFLGYTAYPDEETALVALRDVPKPPPATVEFNHYLHDSYNRHELADWIAQQTGVTISDELREKIDRPFYEVNLRCSLNMTTGEVTLISAKL